MHKDAMWMVFFFCRQEDRWMRNLPKHEKYKSSYGANEMYWGIGIEHEVYLQSLSKTLVWKLDDFLKRTKPERYSVRYYDNYKPGFYETHIQKYFQRNDIKELEVPVFINSNSFQKTDVHGNHATTYEKVPKPNPLFNGKTVFAFLQEVHPYFRECYEREFLFDGDTIEFTTLDFYKTNVQAVLNELKQIEDRFVKELNHACTLYKGSFFEYGPFCIQKRNFPFVSYLTNLQNISMFNNGTIHLNLTMPTQLDSSGAILHRPLFIKQHQAFARLCQWMSPFWIAMYGSPDVFSTVSHAASKASQRCAVMRYIGVGTYNTSAMAEGKILTIDASDVNYYKEINDASCYSHLSRIGLDINFYKHHNLGIELRFFDHCSLSALREIMHTCIYLMDHVRSLEKRNYRVKDPRRSKTWKYMMHIVHRYGYKGLVGLNLQHVFASVFGVSRFPIPKTVQEFYTHVSQKLCRTYQHSFCASNMLSSNGPSEKEDAVRNPTVVVTNANASVPWWICCA